MKIRPPIRFLETMLDYLTSAYTRKDVRNARRGLPLETNIGRLFAVLAWGFEQADETTRKILMWDDLDKAKGKVLDKHGANYGVARNSTNDAFYRLAIKVKMIAMLSSGTADNVLEATAALLDISINDVELNELFPAKLEVVVNRAVLTDSAKEYLDLIIGLMKRIVAVGVGFDLTLMTQLHIQNRNSINLSAVIIPLAVQNITKPSGPKWNRRHRFDNKISWGADIQRHGIVVTVLDEAPVDSHPSIREAGNKCE